MSPLSVVVPGGRTVAPAALARLAQAVAALGVPAEIIAVGASETPHDAPPVRHVRAAGEGYGANLAAGFAAARGGHVLTIDPDIADPGPTLAALWARRDEGDVVIGSRYVPGGRADMPAWRSAGSRLLNGVFSRGLSLGVRDMSSGVRLYRARVLDRLRPLPPGLEALQSMLVDVYAEGWRVVEAPIAYRVDADGPSHRRAVRFGADYAAAFGRLWKLRNSIECADYDARAHDSAIPLQRYWQRSRYRHVTELIAGQGPVLDVGCGSSRIIGALPPGSVAVDVLLRKLRYARRFGRPLVHASGFQLPFADASFPCVLCSQVIEHVPKESPILGELVRVLRPGGRLVLGTPDYANWEWVLTEKLYGFFAPGAYADEHIAHYTREELIARFGALGFAHEATRYILRGELILAFRKPAA